MSALVGQTDTINVALLAYRHVMKTNGSQTSKMLSSKFVFVITSLLDKAHHMLGT